MFRPQTFIGCLRFAALFAVVLSPSLARANVFGRDDRQPVLSRQHPWCCIGLVVCETESGVSTGTGFLIGRNLVLTNAHCAMDDSTGKAASRLYFLANRIDGVASHAAHVNKVWLGTDSLNDDPDQDWAVLRLDANLGDELGWLTLSTELAERGALVGYSGDYREQETAAIAPCSFHDTSSVVLCHDADATRGSSGGPILAERDGKTVVVALNFAEYGENQDNSMLIRAYHDRFANLALPVAHFFERVTSIIEEESHRKNADYVQQARQQLADREHAAAYATLTKLIKACAQNSEARLLRAYVCELQGRENEALADYREALRIDPLCLDHSLVRAAYCLGRGDYEECIALATRVLAVAQNHKPALELRSAAYRKLGQASLAVADAEKAAML